MKAVCSALGVARSNVMQRLHAPHRPRRQRMTDDAAVLTAIRVQIGSRPTYGYRRLGAVLNRERRGLGEATWNHKRIYRVMKTHDLLLQRYTGDGPRPVHDGRVAVDQSDRRWCSDGLEIACQSGERVRVAFTLDCCDREAIGYVATTAGISGEMVRDLMVESLESRFGAEIPLRHGIEWLTDNGSPYIAHETQRFGHELGFAVKRTALRSPQSNGMAEAFVKTLKRDYASIHPRFDAASVLQALPLWINDYNEHHPHRALKMKSPREYRKATSGNT